MNSQNKQLIAASMIPTAGAERTRASRMIPPIATTALQPRAIHPHVSSVLYSSPVASRNGLASSAARPQMKLANAPTRKTTPAKVTHPDVVSVGAATEPFVATLGL